MGFAFCGSRFEPRRVSCLFRVTICVENRNLILKFGKRHVGQSESGSDNMIRAKAVPSLAFVFMGSMDWLTTIIGILYFGAVEANPFFANLTRTSLPAFTVIKLAITICVGLLFHQTKKSLMKTQDENSKVFVRMRYLLKGAYVAATTFLLIAVLNNIVIVARAM